MLTKQIRYHCQNCDKYFELPASDSPRCPSCFWTSAIRSLDEEIIKKEPVKKEKVLTQRTGGKPAASLSPFGIFLIGVLIVLAGYFLIKEKKVPAIKIFLGGAEQSTEKRKASSEKPAHQPSEQIPLADPLAALSEDERAVIAARVEIAIPRTLSNDETQIIKKKVELAVDQIAIPKVKFWTKDSFQDYLTREQKRRGIHFSGGYENKLVKLFEDHYLKAEQLVSAGQAEAAQNELLQSLVFPVYSNDLRLHRAVALVMLEPFIGDVISKIKILNAETTQQGIAQSMRELQENYEGFFMVVKDNDWKQALAYIERLEGNAKSIEIKLNQSEVSYPPVIQQIDQDIRKGLFGVPSNAAVSTTLNSILADLRIKKSLLQQNAPDFLKKMKDDYEKAMKAIDEKKWQDASPILESISYPPELVQDAKHKAAILGKLVRK